MNDGILFYANFERPLPLLIVAIRTLRKVYGGNVHVVFGDTIPKKFIDIVDKQDMFSYSFSKQRYYCESKDKKNNEWYEKPFIIANESPFENTLYYDCDHVFYKKIGDAPFDAIKEYGLVTAICDTYPKKVQEITFWINDTIKTNFDNIKRVNGGCVGYSKSAKKSMQVWQTHLVDFGCSEHILLRYNREEYALATTVKKGMGKIISERYSYGYPRKAVLNEVPKDIIALHYVANRYLLGDLWKNEFLEAINENFMSCRDELQFFISCNNTIDEKMGKDIWNQIQ